MLTEKEKKVGIIMLIISVVLLMTFIIVTVHKARTNVGIRGTGVAAGEAATLVAVRTSLMPKWDGDLSDYKLNSSMSQAVTDGVQKRLLMEVQGEMAIEQAVEQAQEQAEFEEYKDTPIDYDSLRSRMTAGNVHGNPVPEDVPSDNKSLMSLFGPSTDCITVSDLTMLGYNVPASYLNNVYALSDGATVSGNSIDALYYNVIVPGYAEGTYFAFKMTPEGREILGGNEKLMLALPENYEELTGYINSDTTLDELVESGTVAFYENSGTEGEEPFSYSNVYEAAHVYYETTFSEFLSSTEQLFVVHIVNGEACLEKYAVANVWGEEFVSDSEYDYDEEELEDGEMPTPEGEMVSVPLFTGYYAW